MVNSSEVFHSLYWDGQTFTDRTVVEYGAAGVYVTVFNDGRGYHAHIDIRDFDRLIELLREHWEYEQQAR
jgi:hypothetical protein